MSIANSPDLIKPLLKGAKIPSTPLTKADGTTTSLENILNKHAAIVIFYRGSWWRYCLLQLAGIEKNINKFNELGFNVFAICPDVIEGLEVAASKENITFPLLSDSSIATSEGFGLAFHVDDATVKLYLDKYNVDLEAAAKQKHHNLPVPAVYIIAADGTIEFTYINSNYEVRISTEDLLKEAEAVAK